VRSCDTDQEQTAIHFLKVKKMYHANTSAVSRKGGGSSCAKSAYISGNKITENSTGEIHDYTKKQGVEHTEIILPTGINKEITASELWNKSESAEIRKDARVGREWVIGLPHELNQEERKTLSQNLARDIADRYQVGTQLAIHEPSKTGDERNYHVHILTTTRKIDENLNLGDKSDIEKDRKQCAQMKIPTSQEQIIECRERIANRINESLQLAQVNKQVSHLSYKDQGIDKIPTKHMGKSATQLERKGISTAIGEYNRSAMRFNELKTALQATYNTQNVETSPERELSATERAKMYLAKLQEEKATKPEETQDKRPDQDRQKQLLEQILARKSYDQIIDRQKREKEQKLEQQKALEKDYTQTLKKGRGFSR
jgi:hypothetical protein